MGGGEDGAERLDAYLRALALEPPTWDSAIVTGPLLDEADFRRIKRTSRMLGGSRIYRFHGDLPALLEQSQAVVAMAGYNTCVEILQSGKHAVFLPRTFPRREQLIRAERFTELGIAQTLVDPEPRSLRTAVERALRMAVRPTELPPLDGCRRLCEIVDDLLPEAEQEPEPEERSLVS